MNDQAEVLRLKAERTRADELTCNRTHRSRETIIAVGSGKGGVGKSNIALNLALELSWRGRSTCLIDADLGMSNSTILAGVTPRYTLGHLLRDGKRIEEIITQGPLNLGIIAGANGLKELANLSNEDRIRLSRAISGFAGKWDYCVIDSGAGISENVLTFMEKADQCLVVATPEPTSMADAFGLIKVLSERRCRARISVVVNRADSVKEARNVAERLSGLSIQFLNQTVDWAGFLFEDSAVQKSVVKRSPFSAFNRNSRAAQSISRIADCVEKGIEISDIGEDSIGNKFKGWLERLFCDG